LESASTGYAEETWQLGNDETRIWMRWSFSLFSTEIQYQQLAGGKEFDFVVR
jgi:hypothetical protein